MFIQSPSLALLCTMPSLSVHVVCCIFLPQLVLASSFGRALKVLNSKTLHDCCPFTVLVSLSPVCFCGHPSV